MFNLSKCIEPGIRARIASHLRNFDEDMAALVANRLGLADMPAVAPAARPTRTDPKPSPALSIQSNPPESFKGRIMGVRHSDGFDGSRLMALEKAVAEADGLIKIIAPKIGGVTCSKNNLHAVHERIGGAPSVPFDAVAFLPGKDSLATAPAAKALLTDAHQHIKYVGWSEQASALAAVCGLAGAQDDASCALTDIASVQSFVNECKYLRQ